MGRSPFSYMRAMSSMGLHERARARASRPYRCLASCCVRYRRLLLLLLLCVILSRIPSPRPDKCIGPDAIVTMLVCVHAAYMQRFLVRNAGPTR